MVAYFHVGQWVSGLLVVTRGLTEEGEFVVFCLHVCMSGVFDGVKVVLNYVQYSGNCNIGKTNL